MKNNINTSQIHNRKIILEIRFRFKSKILDNKGNILDSIENSKLLNPFVFALGEYGIKAADNSEESNERNALYAEINRFSFISSKIDSVDIYFQKFETMFKAFTDIVGDVEMLRIGCRIIGTYSCKSKTFKELLINFKEVFPDKFYVDQFPVTDLRLQVIYQNGNYNIGPINKGDIFTATNFTHSDVIDKLGTGIDVDNYFLGNDKYDGNLLTKVKDVFTASLAVEKSLFDKLSEM